MSALLQVEDTHEGSKADLFGVHLFDILPGADLSALAFWTHRVPPAFGCCVRDCYSVLFRKADLLRHTQAVHEKDVYPCEMCQLSYSRRDNLLRHIRAKHPES